MNHQDDPSQGNHQGCRYRANHQDDPSQGNHQDCQYREIRRGGPYPLNHLDDRCRATHRGAHAALSPLLLASLLRSFRGLFLADSVVSRELQLLNRSSSRIAAGRVTWRCSRFPPDQASLDHAMYRSRRLWTLRRPHWPRGRTESQERALPAVAHDFPCATNPQLPRNPQPENSPPQSTVPGDQGLQLLHRQLRNPRDLPQRGAFQTWRSPHRPRYPHWNSRSPGRRLPVPARSRKRTRTTPRQSQQSNASQRLLEVGFSRSQIPYFGS